MNRMGNSYKNLFAVLEASKRNPVIGAKLLLKLPKIPYYQQDMLQRLWVHKRPLLLCSRRTGKTFMSAVMMVLKCILYPHTKVGIVAPVFRQAQTVFGEVENIYDHSDFVKAETKKAPTHGNSEWYMDFKNGSRISALPFSDSIRSKGFNIVMVDEYGYAYEGRRGMNHMVSNIIKPMLFTKREVALGQNLEADKTDVGNQLIIASTATFKWNDYYKTVQDYDKKIKEGSKEHDIISYDYRDGLDSGLFEKDAVLEEFHNADSLTRKKEFLNIFPDEMGGLISYELLAKKAIDTAEISDIDNDKYIPPKTQIEFEQPLDEDGHPIDKYILAFDDADQGRDNFACAVIKMDGGIKRLVRIVALDNDPIQEKIKLIRGLLKDFNIVKIVADQRHQNIKDNLAEPYTYKDGTKGEIIIDVDDEEQRKYVKRQYPDHDIRELLEIHTFTNRTNEIRARHFLSEIEKGRFKIPADPKGGMENKKVEDAYNEIKKTIHEIISIVPQSAGKYTRYDTETDSQTKDRWTVCELGVFMADEMNKAKDRKKKIFVGKWG